MRKFDGSIQKIICLCGFCTSCSVWWFYLVVTAEVLVGFIMVKLLQRVPTVRQVLDSILGLAFLGERLVEHKYAGHVSKSICSAW
jgi:hypothetical protein